jgi:hypothetical protein
MAKFLVKEKGANPNLRWKSFPYTLLAQAMPFQYEPDQHLIRFHILYSDQKDWTKLGDLSYT